MTAERQVPPTREQQELQELADDLAGIVVAGLGPQSRWALRAALNAADTEGIKGTLIFHVPQKVKDHLDCSFTTGSGDIHLT